MYSLLQIDYLLVWQDYSKTCYTTLVPRSQFDAKFFKRFYSTTPMHSILDIGAGVGYWSDWYRNELEKYFRQAGTGLWIAKTSTIVLDELEDASS